jgi:hypothetical protein
MKLMHTKLPEFIKKMKEAAIRGKRPKDIEIKGLENLTSAKMQSLRTGRIEQAVSEIAERDSVEKLEINVIPRNQPRKPPIVANPSWMLTHIDFIF